MPLDGTNFDSRPQAAAVLRRAKALLRERGWCQGKAVSGDGRLCIVGAIREAGRLRTGTEWAALGIPWPTAFNDAPGRTQAEAEAWLDEQIALCEEGRT